MATQPTELPINLNRVDTSRYEFVDGRLVERAVPGDVHAQFQAAVADLLRPLAQSIGAKVRQEWSVNRTELGKEYMTPDVMMSFPGEYRRTKIGHLVAPAFLCIEITSPGQNEENAISKAQRYHAWGIPNCWVIDPESRLCLEYHGGNEIIIARDVLRALSPAGEEPAINLILRIDDIFRVAETL